MSTTQVNLWTSEYIIADQYVLDTDDEVVEDGAHPWSKGEDKEPVANLDTYNILEKRDARASPFGDASHCPENES